MPQNLIIKSLGKIELSSGDGLPDHVAPISSVYTDTTTGDSYINTTGFVTGWTPIRKEIKTFVYSTNNTSTTLTATNSWLKINNFPTLTGSDLFTFSTFSTILSDTGDGGFVNTTNSGTQGFVNNGWVVLNGAQTNKWFVGTTGASGPTGFGAYVSSTNGATNIYASTTPDNAVYFYRDIVIPAYSTNCTINFLIRVGGEGNLGGPYYDYVSVFSVPTTQTFTPGVVNTAQQLGQFNRFNPATVATSSFFSRSVNFTVSPSSSTQSRRIAFGWFNDGSTLGQPAPSIDNISITTTLPMTINYTGSQSTFRVLLTGSFQSAVSATAITNVGVLIGKNNSTTSNLSESSYNLSTTNRKDSFAVQAIFTMSSGDTISPFVNNKVSNTSVIFNDLQLSIWEI